ncbi:MAG: Eco57I restriction-modification methylase domain-containing protein, partial [Opitutaceae bacterium]
MPLDLVHSRQLIQDFEFHRLFIDELGWSQPRPATPATGTAGGQRYTRTPIAEMSGIVVFEITHASGAIPDARARALIDADVTKHFREHLLIFLDADRTQSLWVWMKREGARTFPRDHLYLRGQPGDLFLSKIAALVIELTELERHDGALPLAEVASRLRNALDVKRVTKRFFTDFDRQRLAFTELIEGIDSQRDRQWYASALVNRLMFIWFLQRKQFLDGGDADYLPKKLAASQKRGRDRFFSEFLRVLLFEGFAQPENARSSAARKLLGRIRYLNGGLFLPHHIEREHGYT